MDRLHDPPAPDLLQFEEMDVSGNRQRRYPGDSVPDRTSVIPELVRKFCHLGVALRLGIITIIGGCCQKHHDDQQHPDELVHLQQEAVG